MIPADSPREFAGLFRVERHRLLDLLHSLELADWDSPSPCPGWGVLGLAAHLLDDDIVYVASWRDGHRGTPAPQGLSEQQFIEWLDGVQVEWVHAARRFSLRQVIELLEWTDEQVADVVAAQDPAALTANVSWASTAPVPAWLDQGRELSERWIHRQQLLQAVDRPSDLRADLAGPVLDGLRWAYPFRLAADPRPEESAVEITVTGPEVQARWNLICDGTEWQFGSDREGSVVARLEMTTEQAWRLLTNNYDESMHGPVQATGDSEIVDTLKRTRAIIGTPK